MYTSTATDVDSPDSNTALSIRGSRMFWEMRLEIILTAKADAARTEKVPWEKALLI